MGQKSEPYRGAWLTRRGWGWVATPRILPGGVLGAHDIQLFFYRPDLPAYDVARVSRYLSYKYGTARLYYLLPALAVLICLSALPAPVSGIVLFGATLFTCAVADAVTLRVLRRRADSGLGATRSARSAVTIGRSRILGPDVKPKIHNEDLTQVLAALDLVDSLHEDRLIETHEWDQVRWLVWDVFGTRQMSQDAIGWPTAIARLDELIQRAARRLA